MKRLLLLLIPFTVMADESITSSVSPSFLNSSAMNGSQSNVAVQNVILSQEQAINGIVCQSGWQVNANAYSGRNTSNPVYDPMRLGYESEDYGFQFQVGTTFGDNNEQTCTDAQKAMLLRIKHSNTNDFMQFCGSFYATITDAKAPYFNFNKMRKIKHTAKHLVNNVLHQTASKMLDCLAIINLDEDKYHAKFANIPKPIASVIKRINKPIYKNFRVHYGNYNDCDKCVKDRVKKIIDSTGIKEDGIKVISYYDKTGKPKQSVNVVGFNSEREAKDFAFINRVRLPYSRIVKY